MEEERDGDEGGVEEGDDFGAEGEEAEDEGAGGEEEGDEDEGEHEARFVVVFVRAGGIQFVNICRSLVCFPQSKVK